MTNVYDVELRRKGYDPDEIRSAMQRYIRGDQGQSFGSGHEYGAAIEAKQAAGIPLDDPYTAQAFQEGIAPHMQPVDRTEFRFGATGVAPQVEGFTDKSQSMLDAIARHEKENPLSIPVAPGTPTRWQTLDQEARESAEWERDFAERKFAYQQEQDAIANQLARMRMSSSGGGGVRSAGVSGDDYATTSAGGFAMGYNPSTGEIPELERILSGISTKDAREDAAQAYFVGLRNEALGTNMSAADINKAFDRLEAGFSRYGINKSDFQFDLDTGLYDRNISPSYKRYWEDIESDGLPPAMETGRFGSLLREKPGSFEPPTRTAAPTSAPTLSDSEIRWLASQHGLGYADIVQMMERDPEWISKEFAKQRLSY